MKQNELAALEKKYPKNIVWNQGRIIRRDLDDLVFIIKINNQLNEITKKAILEKLLLKVKKAGL
jgi:hypothetical protein